MNKPFIQLGPDQFSIDAFDVKPIEGYEKPVNSENKKELPYCCERHEKIYYQLLDYYKSFPNCCEWHKPLNDANWFKKEDYGYVVEKVINQLSYTEHCIVKFINEPDWYDAIVDYIIFNISSFGQLLKGYGNPVGLSIYTKQLEHYIKNSKDEIPKSKRTALLKAFEINEIPKQTEKTDLNVLFTVYQKWLKVFPFDLSLFKHLKEPFEKRMPFLSGKHKTNRYSGLTSVSIHTKASLIRALVNLTNNILTQINTVSLYEKGLLNEPNKIQLELIINERKNKILSGYVNESQDEDQRYRKILKEWYKDEVQFIDKLIPLIPKQIEQLDTNTTKVIEGLNQYNFTTFLTENKYKPTDIYQLIQKHSGKELMPYTIALLSELKYLKYFFDEYSKNKNEGLKKLSVVFEVSERRIKGNVNILNDGSNEDAAQYTSHKYIEKISKSLKGL